MYYRDENGKIIEGYDGTDSSTKSGITNSKFFMPTVLSVISVLILSVLVVGKIPIKFIVSLGLILLAIIIAVVVFENKN
jgi:hypothetical protein